jgi:hypothetical protein
VTDLAPKWSKYAFFNGGTSKNPTLQESFNRTLADSTSAQIADEILFRANLIDRPFYSELLTELTNVLESIDNPTYFCNRLDVVNQDAIPQRHMVTTKDPEAYSVVGENTESNVDENSDNEVSESYVSSTFDDED